MNSKLSLTLVLILLIALKGYSQEDSVRTKNDKPGTPQSLRTPDQAPQSKITIINSNAAPGQTINNAATGGNGINTVVISGNNTTGKPSPASTSTSAKRPRIDTSIQNSAIQNGISNTTNPIRNQ